MNARLTLLALPLALAACDEQAMKDFRMPWDKPAPVVAAAPAPTAPPKPAIPEPTGASPTQQPLEVGKQAIEAAQNLLDGKKIETKVNVPVLPLTRADTQAVAAYKEGLKALK